MIAPVLALLAMAAPGGYLAGSVYLEMNDSDQDWLPYAGAFFIPLGAILALLCIIQGAQK